MTPLRTPERDAAIDTLLAAGLGPATWRVASLRAHVEPDADLLFPGGPIEMVEVFTDLADRRMAAWGTAERIGEQPSLTGRVRALLIHRLGIDRAQGEAARRALAILLLPANAARAAASLARTADAIWRASGDRSADFSWYTRRATLAAVYGATVLYALDPGRTDEEVAAFLDRRLAGLAALGRRRRRASPPPPPPPATG